MANIIAPVKNGELDYSYTDSSAKAKKTMGSDMGYDQFLQLLCAEMQYQDPLQPTSNTDYVAQLATFSQLEATLGMQQAQTSDMANNLVGKTVHMSVPNENTGKTTEVSGNVDKVVFQDDKTYLSVNGNLYPVEYLDTVEDEAYTNAKMIAESFSNMVGQIPSDEYLTTTYSGALSQLTELYDSLSDYERAFLDQDDVNRLNSANQRMAELIAAEKDAAVSVSDRFAGLVRELPSVEELTAEHQEAVASARKVYDGMTEYQKTYVEEEDLKKLESLEERMAVLVPKEEV